MWLIYYTEVSVFFTLISEHTDAFVLSWHKFKNFVTVESVSSAIHE